MLIHFDKKKTPKQKSSLPAVLFSLMFLNNAVGRGLRETAVIL